MQIDAPFFYPASVNQTSAFPTHFVREICFNHVSGLHSLNAGFLRPNLGCLFSVPGMFLFTKFVLCL